VIAGVIVALVVIAGVWFLFGRGKDSIIPNPFSSPAVVPTFHFKTVVPKYEALQAQIPKAKLDKVAKQTAPTIEKVTTEFLQSGYVNPDGWGDSGSIRTARWTLAWRCREQLRSIPLPPMRSPGRRTPTW
jgi:hypothetical protein